MPIRPPALDDRSFDDLVSEALSRIPAHTPEWTNPRLGDPGRTIVELFAWLTDTLLYRANLVPERQRLVFLRLLGIQMRAATAARGVVSIFFDDANEVGIQRIAEFASFAKPVPFESRQELTVLPVTAEPFYKRPLSRSEEEARKGLIDGLRTVYQLPTRARAYMTTPVFMGGTAEPTGFDVIASSVDRSLWLALLAGKPEQVEAVRTALGSPVDGAQNVLNIGIVPAIEVPEQLGIAGAPPRKNQMWAISSVKGGVTEYHQLDVIADTTEGFTQRGVVRVVLPSKDYIGAPENDVRRLLHAGVGEQPPRLDVPELANRLVAWIRLRPNDVGSLKLSWVGINAVEIDQRETVTGRIVGQSNGAADQVMTLSSHSVEPESLELQVEESGVGYRTWTQVDDLAIAGRDDAVLVLDAESGTVRFGDGVRGRIPEAGRRVRVARLRAGGGATGNLPAGSITKIMARDLARREVQKPLRVQQSVPTIGGADPETLAEAERRVPALFRHRDRAVTERDYREIAASTPGVQLGRVEVLPRFKPQQRRDNVPGVVTVMVLPQKEGTSIPAPRPDRPTLERVHAFLDTRRTLGTELYVIGCEYVPVALLVGVHVRDGFGRDTVGQAVRDALRAFLWPLVPGGNDGTGWPLSRDVKDRELEVVVARVAGVDRLEGISLLAKHGDDWRAVPRSGQERIATIPILAWQLPELVGVAVATDGTMPAESMLFSTPRSRQQPAEEIAVPVVPEVC